MSQLIRSTLAATALLFAVGPASAATGQELADNVSESLGKLYSTTPSAKALAEKAEGILVFPSVYKAGVGIGGSYGEGALVAGKDNKLQILDYYNLVAASAGLQLGAQKQSVVLMFMTDSALQRFRSSEGWKAGVDGSVAIIETGIGGSLDTETIQEPIVGFVYSNTGLMAGVTLEGSKFTKIRK